MNRNTFPMKTGCSRVRARAQKGLFFDLFLMMMCLFTMPSGAFAQVDTASQNNVSVGDCTPEGIPFVVAFEQDSATAWDSLGVIPACWSFQSDATDSAYFPHVSSDYALYGNSLLLTAGGDSAVYGTDCYVVLPMVQYDLNDMSFSFQTKMESLSRGELSIGYWRTVADTVEFVTLENVPSDESIVQRTFSLRNRSIPSDVRLALLWHNTDSCAHCAIDSIIVDSLQLCLAPVITTFEPISESEMQLVWSPGWNERIWLVEYGPVGFTHGNGEIRYVYSSTYTLTGLTANTRYDVYVRGICNSGASTEWSLKRQGLTPCSATPLPYYENFDGYTPTAASVAGVLPSCWDVFSNATVPGNRPHISDYLATSPENGVVMTSALAAAYGGANYAILPWFESDLNGAKITFNARMENPRTGVLVLGYFTNVLEENTFVVLDTIPSSPSATASLEHQISLYHRGVPRNARLAFRWYYAHPSWNAYCSVDDVAVEFLECPRVTNLAVSDVRMTTADISWTPGDEETEWSLEYGPSGFRHDDAQHQVLTLNDTTVTLTGLVGGQPIDVYVQAVCDPRNPSAYSDVLTFTPYCSVYGDTTVVEACDSFVWHGQTYRENGLWIDTLFQAAADFCDSITSLDLTIHHSYNQFDSLIICQNDLPYVWRDTTFDTNAVNGDFIFYRTSVNGCDSVVHLNLVVNPAFYLDEYDTICQQALPYTWRDTVFDVGTANGDFTFERHSEYGCDSLVTLHLVVYESFAFTEVAQICQQELPYTWRDTTFGVGTQSDIFTFHRESVDGCDSIVTFALVVHPSYNEDVTLNICRNELPYTWRDTTFGADAQSGVFQFSAHTAHGCDSVVTLTLVIGESGLMEDTVDICESELPYVWQDTIFRVGTQTGTFIFGRPSANGCGDTTILHLNVHPIYFSEMSESICDHELPILLMDTLFEEGTTSGDYVFNHRTQYGCDSSILLHLTVNQGVEQFESADICRGRLPYTWRDTTFLQGTNSGTYVFRRATAAGCDSIVYFTLTLHESYGATEYLTVCENDLPVEWRGHVIPRGATSGLITYQDHTVYGCDSIVVLTLTVNPTYSQNEEATVCENELPYTWRDTTFDVRTQSGVFFFERTSSKGCDSTVRLTLTVYPSQAEQLSLTLCESELTGGYQWRDTVFQEGTQSGIYTFQRHTLHGCDSTVTLALTIHPTYEQEESFAICAEELPIVWRDTVFQTGTTTADYTFHRRTAAGCDSTVTLHLTIYPRFEQSKQYAICREELPYTTEDTTFGADAVGGQYTVHYQSTNGCDSVIQIQLEIHPNYNQTETAIICQNELPYIWRDTVFEVGTQSGVYQFNRKTTEHQCDSVVALALIVHPSYDQDEFVDICDNDFPYSWRDTVFQMGTSDGDYLFHRQTIHGCDSNVTLHVRIHPTYEQSESISICQSDLPYTWRDTTFQEGTVSGIHTFQRHSQYGCDSTVTLLLAVNPTLNTNYSIQICTEDLPYTWQIEDTVFDVGTVSGTYFFHHTNQSGCDSNVILDVVVNPSYSFTDAVTICANELPYYYEPENYYFPIGTVTCQHVFRHLTSSGCDSLLTLSLTVNPSYNENVTVRLCDNDFPYEWRDTLFAEGTLSGTYTFQKTSQYGCDSVVTLTLFVYPQPNVSIIGNANIFLGDTTTLLAQGSNNCSYLWNTGETGTSITVWPEVTTTYSVTVVSNSGIGCSNTASITVVVTDTNVSVENIDLSHLVTVYPNPTTGHVTVRSDEFVIHEICLYDLNGKQVIRRRVDDLKTELELLNFAPGTYLLQLQMRDGEIVRKKVLLTH